MSRFVNLELGGEAESLPEKLLAKDEPFYFGEAQSAFEQGRFEPALRHFSKVLEFNPRNAAAWTAQVRMLIELTEYREAKLWADQALDRFPHEPELLAAKAVALGRSGALQEAIAFSDASIEERGDTPYIWLARGDVLLARQERRADYCFEKVLHLAPHDWSAHWMAGRIRCFYQQFVLALSSLQKAMELNATNYMVWLELGRCQRSLGMVGPARASLQQAQQLDPNRREAELELVELSETGVWGVVRGWGRRLVKP